MKIYVKHERFGEVKILSYCMSLSKVNSSRAAKRKRLDILVLWYRVRHSVRFGRWVHNNRTCHVGVRIVVVQILCAFDDGDVRKSIFRFLFPC